ncbi:MAG: ATP-dependent DNA helicase [Pseudomonadota bacterium]
MMDIDALLGAEGPVAGAVQNYQPRLSQQLMAQAVMQAIENGERLVVEAGTGTGKTFAYLLPALLGGARTIVSTGTRALQDQLFHRDLPTISKTLGRPVKTALLKGRSNYLCLHRLDLALQDATAVTSAQARILSEWRDHTRDGDRREVTEIPEDDAVWQRVTSTADNCLGQQCPFFDDCYVVGARRKAQKADLVVINHHLLMADLAFREGGFVEFLPDADAIIIDEAHQLPDIALEFFGTSVSHRQFLDVLAELEVALAGFATDAVETRLRTARRAALVVRESAPREAGRYESQSLPESLHGAVTQLNDALDDLIGAVDAIGHLEPAQTQHLDRLLRVSDRLRIVAADSDEDGMRWVDVTRRGMRWHMTPLDIAPRMRAAIDTTGAAWVLTSATLAVGEDFSHILNRLGLDDARCVQFATPFALAERARLLLPGQLPMPQDQKYIPSLLALTTPLLSATHGGAFFLHTSYRALRESAEWFAQRPALLGDRPLLVQGDQPRDRLLAEFRNAGDAVLLGTGTFWEGVDVRGEALTLVVIDKLPFAVPDDPLLVARSAHLQRQGLNPFRHHQLPEAVLALKQGAGRLLRDPADYGVIVIGDRRITERGYGRMFVSALGPMPVLTNVADAARFLESMQNAARATETLQ